MTGTLANERLAALRHDAVRNKVLLITRVAADVDAEELHEWRDALGYADSFGPFMDPTGWMRRRDELLAVKELADAFAAFRVAAVKAKGTLLDVMARQMGDDDR